MNLLNFKKHIKNFGHGFLDKLLDCPWWSPELHDGLRGLRLGNEGVAGVEGGGQGAGDDGPGTEWLVDVRGEEPSTHPRNWKYGTVDHTSRCQCGLYRCQQDHCVRGGSPVVLRRGKISGNTGPH